AVATSGRALAAEDDPVEPDVRVGEGPARRARRGEATVGGGHRQPVGALDEVLDEVEGRHRSEPRSVIVVDSGATMRALNCDSSRPLSLSVSIQRASPPGP